MFSGGISSLGEYYVITRERVVPSLLIHHLNRTVGSFSETEVSIKFRFRDRGQLQLLFDNLRVPNFFRFIDDDGENHGRVRGDEAYLVGLARLSSTKTLHDLVADFGRDYTWISRSFDAFVRWTEGVHGWRRKLLSHRSTRTSSSSPYSSQTKRLTLSNVTENAVKCHCKE